MQRKMTVGTFHGSAFAFLRVYHTEANLPKHFTVADEDMQIEVLSRVVKNVAPDNRARTLRTIMQRLERKTRLNDSPSVKPLSNLKNSFSAITRGAEKKLPARFDDILIVTHQLFTEHPGDSARPIAIVSRQFWSMNSGY